MLNGNQEISTLAEFLNKLHKSKSLVFVASTKKAGVLKKDLKMNKDIDVSVDEKEFHNEEVIFTDYSSSNLPE